jgi:sterol 3beta-glucosyltransferase
MRTTIFAAGSRGDIQPCIQLGQGLRTAGLGVRLAVPNDFAAFGQAHGLEVSPLRGDVQAIMASDTGRALMERGGANPLRTIAAMRKLLAPVALQMAADALAACDDADALISLAVFAPLAQTIASLRRIPLILVEPTPLFPTGAFAAPGWPLQRNLGPVANHLTGVAMLQVLWQWYRPFINDFRQQHGLPPASAASFYRTLSAHPLLGAYSPSVIPRPTDWPAGVQITGAWLPEPSAAWQPPAELAAFLASGAPPVYIGFGSMAGQRPEALAALVLEALARSGQRGVLLTGWGGLRTANVPTTVCVVTDAPHSWLFPRMAAVVHHGGAGTTAEGLRAGVPSVIVPFSFDQPFWGERVRALGVGPTPIPQARLSAENLAAALTQAVHDQGLRERAAALGATLCAEDGVGQAVARITAYLK